MASRVVVVRADDYEAIYRDGVLQLEGFVLNPEAVLRAVCINSDVMVADLDWFEEQGQQFPESLGDVKWQHRKGHQ